MKGFLLHLHEVGVKMNIEIPPRPRPELIEELTLFITPARFQL